LIRTLVFCAGGKERFDVSMSGKLEGIGARPSKKMISLKFQNLFRVVGEETT
jgi:hypothetical protein